MRPYLGQRRFRILWVVLGFVILLIGMQGMQSVGAQGTSPLEGSEKIVLSGDTAPPEGIVEYAIVVRNDGTDTLTDVPVFDYLSPRLECLSVSATPSERGGGQCEADYARATAYYLPPYSAVTFTLRSQLKPMSWVLDMPITNTALISDGVNLVRTNVVSVTMIELPPVHSQIDAPAKEAVVAEREWRVQGRAWTGDLPPFPLTPQLHSISDATLPYVYEVSWEPVTNTLLSGYLLQESVNDPTFAHADEAEFIPDGTTSEEYSNPPAGTYYYRVRALGENGLLSRWSDIQSITVGSGRYVAPSAVAPAAPALTAAEDITVEVNIKPTGVVTDSWRPVTALTLTEESAGTWWDWSYTGDLPVEEDPTSYTIQTRAKIDGGPFGEVDTINVTLFNAKPRLTITKQSNVSSVAVGGEIEYTLMVTNTGPFAVDDLVITDALPIDTAFIDTGSGQLMANDVVSWTVDELAGGEQTSVTLAVRPLRSDVTVRNEAYGVLARGFYIPGQRTVEVSVGDAYVYLPLVMRRWPPIPYAPTMNAIDNDDLDDEYTVSWSYNHPNVPVSSFTLQEATDRDFTEDVITYTIAAGTFSKAISDQDGDTYYYRVRGVNAWGLGAWSNVVEAVVQNDYIYNFYDSGNREGWGVRRYDSTSGDLDDYKVKVFDGSMYTGMWGRFDQMIVSPMELGPSDSYKYRARVQLVDHEAIDGEEYTIKSGMAYAFVFNGNGGSPCPADRHTPKGEGCLSHYYRLLVVYDQGNANFLWNLKRIDYHDPDNDGKGTGHTLIDWKTAQPGDVLGWNTWEVSVSDAETNNIRIRLNGDLIGKATDHEYLDERYFGVYFESPVFGQAAAKWDWIKIETK